MVGSSEDETETVGRECGDNWVKRFERMVGFREVAFSGCFERMPSQLVVPCFYKHEILGCFN